MGSHQAPQSIVIPDIEYWWKVDEDKFKLEDSGEKEDIESAPEVCDTKTSALHDRSDCITVRGSVPARICSPMCAHLHK